MTFKQNKMEVPKLEYGPKAELERKHKLKVYIHWQQVPDGLITKTDAVKKGLFKIGCVPSAIKLSIVTKSVYYLYDFSNQS